MQLIIKIAAVGLLVAVINQMLSKAGKEEYTTFTMIAGLIVAFLMLLPELKGLLDELSSVFEL